MVAEKNGVQMIGSRVRVAFFSVDMDGCDACTQEQSFQRRGNSD